MALLRDLYREAATEEVGGSGLDVAHPDVGHLLGVHLDLGLLTLFALVVELHLVWRKVGRDLLFLLLFLTIGFRLWNECLDECEVLMQRPEQFTRDFFLTLRSCGQMGLSILTASQRLLSEMAVPTEQSSPFYNIFPMIRLGSFGESDAAAFVALQRPEVPPFSAEDQADILAFAQGHPLALQVACFHVLEVKRCGGSTAAALREAGEQMKALLPGWPGIAP